MLLEQSKINHLSCFRLPSFLLACSGWLSCLNSTTPFIHSCSLLLQLLTLNWSFSFLYLSSLSFTLRQGRVKRKLRIPELLIDYPIRVVSLCLFEGILSLKLLLIELRKRNHLFILDPLATYLLWLIEWGKAIELPFLFLYAMTFLSFPYWELGKWMGFFPSVLSWTIQLCLIASLLFLYSWMRLNYWPYWFYCLLNLNFTSMLLFIYDLITWPCRASFLFLSFIPWPVKEKYSFSYSFSSLSKITTQDGFEFTLSQSSVFFHSFFLFL